MNELDARHDVLANAAQDKHLNKMDERDNGEFGAVLLRCRWRRAFSWVQLAVGLGVSIAFFYVLLAEKSWFLKLPAASFALLGAVAVAFAVRNIVRPTVLFEATTRGVLMYVEGGGVRLASPFFIPWERIESLEYRVRKGVDAASGVLTSRTVALKVTTDAAWTPAAHLMRSYEKSAGVVYLDAVTGNVRGRKLLRRLEEIKAQYDRKI